MKPKGGRGSRHGGTDFIGGADKKGLIVRGDLPPSAHFPPPLELPCLDSRQPWPEQGLPLTGA